MRIEKLEKEKEKVLVLILILAWVAVVTCLFPARTILFAFSLGAASGLISFVVSLKDIRRVIGDISREESWPGIISLLVCSAISGFILRGYYGGLSLRLILLITGFVILSAVVVRSVLIIACLLIRDFCSKDGQ